MPTMWYINITFAQKVGCSLPPPSSCEHAAFKILHTQSKEIRLVSLVSSHVAPLIFYSLKIDYSIHVCFIRQFLWLRK